MYVKLHRKGNVDLRYIDDNSLWEDFLHFSVNH